MSRSKNKILFIGCLLMSVMFCRAQDNPLYNQYQYNGLAINPAFAGSREVLNMAVLYRTQWLDIPGSPSTFTFSGDFPLRNPQTAIGLLAVNDKVGIYRKTGVYGVYAYRVKMGKGKLSFGLQGGLDLIREDLSNITTIQPNDPMFESAELHRTWMPNVGAGAFYYAPGYFVGLSVPKLLHYTPVKADQYKGALSLYDVLLYGGVMIPVSNNAKLKPSALLRYGIDKTLLADINLNFVFLPEDRVEVGISYRSAKVWGAMAEIRVNPQICVGYAYDQGLGVANINAGSHEIFLRYELRYRVKAENPLYLK
ncbi:MAG: type IX secretion system membrane protein PorP/SprF [Bacteroidales bacterium]|jgi:type IX secretion system PorP/SprF family membrane protein|nr:type IX secretion system membrane protein PorP/SprF [Bacteroidales bacterium]